MVAENKPQYQHFKERVPVSFADDEVILDPSLCKRGITEIVTTDSGHGTDVGKERGGGTESKGGGKPEIIPSQKMRKELRLTFPLQTGKFSDLSRIFKMIDTKFRSVTIAISAKDGEISESEFNQSIHEAFEQLGIPLEDTSQM